MISNLTVSCYHQPAADSGRGKLSDEADLDPTLPQWMRELILRKRMYTRSHSEPFLLGGSRGLSPAAGSFNSKHESVGFPTQEVGPHDSRFVLGVSRDYRRRDAGMRPVGESANRDGNVGASVRHGLREERTVSWNGCFVRTEELEAAAAVCTTTTCVFGSPRDQESNTTPDSNTTTQTASECEFDMPSSESTYRRRNISATAGTAAVILNELAVFGYSGKTRYNTNLCQDVEPCHDMNRISAVSSNRKHKVHAHKSSYAKEVIGDDSNFSSGEYEYGPGIVNRLRHKFINLSLSQERDSERGVRRTASLENLFGGAATPSEDDESKESEFDDGDDSAIEHDEEGRIYDLQRRCNRSDGSKRKKSELKKARSMETLIDSAHLPAVSDITAAFEECAPTTACVVSPTLSNGKRGGEVFAAMFNEMIANPKIVIVESDKTRPPINPRSRHSGPPLTTSRITNGDATRPPPPPHRSNNVSRSNGENMFPTPTSDLGGGALPAPDTGTVRIIKKIYEPLSPRKRVSQPSTINTNTNKRPLVTTSSDTSLQLAHAQLRHVKNPPSPSLRKLQQHPPVTNGSIGHAMREQAARLKTSEKPKPATKPRGLYQKDATKTLSNGLPNGVASRPPSVVATQANHAEAKVRKFTLRNIWVAK